ncbi:hypothetical protein B0H10DRAFT_1970928 [Mycena sp. CBHHK59/15]|nr:hypothetical protein B0H10DRAFT_1970928 [Mycena sp. CBHHK59/15]
MGELTVLVPILALLLLRLALALLLRVRRVLLLALGWVERLRNRKRADTMRGSRAGALTPGGTLAQWNGRLGAQGRVHALPRWRSFQCARRIEARVRVRALARCSMLGSGRVGACGSALAGGCRAAVLN